MNLTYSEAQEWRKWILITSIPLVRLDEKNTLAGFASCTMLDHAGSRFIIASEHVVKRESEGWAAVIQQDGNGQLEYYRPNRFTYVGEFNKSTSTLRLLDICVAEVSAELETWYEYRTPRGLFDKQRHHIFKSESIASPVSGQIYGFSGQVRTEKHGSDAVSDMAVYPGLAYSHSEGEIHYFKLPVKHPGNEAFHGCSGAPIVDFNRNIVALVVGGDPKTNMIKGIAIQRVLANLNFLSSLDAA
ncbi:MAG: hypothetical protein NTV00_07030 [Methylococcales bacterium]|nr:hypothetical protein [Methylococcales bacterium]